jgi:dTDP-4-dehydrorhamnose reductase
MTKALITGSTGLLGPYLKDAVLPHWEVLTSSLSGGDLPADLTDTVQTKNLIKNANPDLVFHCAAMTNVDDCEVKPQKAQALNVQTVSNLVSHLPARAKLVYVSTDQVYPNISGPHKEGQTNPINVYGKTKLEGEVCALSCAENLVLRVNFFGASKTPRRQSLSDWLISNLEDRNPITLFTDSIFSPLHLDTLTQMIVDAVRNNLTGVFNLGCRAGGSKCDFANAIAVHLGLPLDAAIPGLSKMTAIRAKDLRMDVSRIEKALQRSMPTLREEIARL